MSFCCRATDVARVKWSRSWAWAWAVVARMMLQGPGLAQKKRVTSLAPVEPAEATRFRARLSTSAHTQHEVRDNNHA